MDAQLIKNNCTQFQLQKLYVHTYLLKQFSHFICCSFVVVVALFFLRVFFWSVCSLCFRYSDAVCECVFFFYFKLN